MVGTPGGVSRGSCPSRLCPKDIAPHCSPVAAEVAGALLRQPHGFEGLALARVGVPADAFSASPPMHLPHRRVEGRVALGPATAHTPTRDGDVTEVAYLEDLDV